MKIQSNITREGKVLMKQLKIVSRLKIKKQKMRKITEMERETAFEKV